MPTPPGGDDDEDDDKTWLKELFRPKQRPLPPHSSDEAWLAELLKPTACKSRLANPPTAGGAVSGHDLPARQQGGLCPSCPSGGDVPFDTFVSFEQIQSDLAARGTQLPLVPLAPPAQDTIVKYCGKEVADAPVAFFKIALHK